MLTVHCSEAGGMVHAGIPTQKQADDKQLSLRSTYCYSANCVEAARCLSERGCMAG